jgi:GAF domain-containing protein
LIRTQTEAATALTQARYYERNALPRSRTLIATALRMREAGQVDYLTFLRTLDQAFAIQREYTAQIQSFETARIKLLYLIGQ